MLHEGAEELFFSVDVVKLGVPGLRRKEKPELRVVGSDKKLNVSGLVL